MTHQVLPRTVHIVCLSAFTLAAALAAEPKKGNQLIEYTRDIAPIFANHCVSCHGPERAESNFRLDSAAYLRADIDSPYPILGHTLEGNELYRRITSDDPAYRMPAEGDPLSVEDRELVRNWILQGMRLEDATPAVGALGRLSEAFNSHPGWRVLVVLLLAANVGILGFELYKRRVLEREAADGSPSWLKGVGPLHYAYIWTLFAMAAGVIYHDFAMSRQRDEFETLRAVLHKHRNFMPGLEVEQTYGNPPVPVRLDHPKAVQQVYYRGNDERDSRLFNGGYYRTSTLHVRLVHDDGVPLDIGDEIRVDEAFIELSFDRAPHTQAVLYRDTVIQMWNYASSHYPSSEVKNDPDRASVEVVESGHLWRMRYPIDKSSKDPHRVQGLVYMYYRDKPHYGIVYDLVIEDGKLVEGSDIWLGNVYTLPNLLPPIPSGFVPQREWLDHEPIPVLPGPQSVTDPDVLGITEHLGRDTVP